MMKLDKEFWQSKRGKAIIKLGIWGGVFALVLLSTFFLPQGEGNGNNQEEVTFEAIMDEFVDSDYLFEYDIVVGGVYYYYEGMRLDDVVTGYKTTNDQTIRYKIEDGFNYQVTSGGNLLMEDLYLGLNEEFVDVEKLDKYLANYEYNEKEEYIYEFENEEYDIIVTVDRKNGVKIEIANEIDSYKLYFSNINNIFKMDR